ncbi:MULTISPECIES: hypothetical protein [Brachybacterium]|uniref:hypothetical protein n=1 Tax=Brachybacterium TaxID=43668 RepID=UPI00126656AE|nr:hypothetical protein [Brachybacterium subflavum]
MTTLELTDPDGDCLTITIDCGSIWITCTNDVDEVTVGPFAPNDLGSLSRAAARYSRPWAEANKRHPRR